LFFQRNPSDYLARKKEKEEEEQKEKSRSQRRSTGSADNDSGAKRRSYVIDKDDSDTKDRGSKKGSYTLDHSVDTEPKKYRQDRKPRESYKSLAKNEFLKKTRGPLPLPPVSSPERLKFQAPQPPTVKSPRQQRQESPPPTVKSPRQQRQEAPPTVKSPRQQRQESPPPTVKSPRQQRQEAPPTVKSPRQQRQESPPVESQPAIDQLKETPDTKTQSQRKKNIAPQPSIPNVIQTSKEISDQVDNSEIISKNNEVCDHVIDDNQVTLQEEIVSQQSDIVESGTFTFKQVEIINPQSSSDKNTDQREEDSPLFVNETQGEKNIKGILKRKNQDKTEPSISNIEVLENHCVKKIANNSQENNISNNLIENDLDERDIIITHSEKTLPDTISLTSLTSIESEPPPLPDTIPPLLPDICPPTPVLSRKIEVHQPDIQIEKKSSTVTMENAKVEKEIVQIQSSAQVQNEPPTSREGVISPHSQKVADLRAEFFGMSKSPPPVISAETTGMDVYLNDLKLEAKTKEFEEEDSDISDSEEEDDYDKVGFKAIFIPGMRSIFIPGI
jgi:hypothetical protein